MRKYTVPKKHDGGYRDIDKEIDSLSIQNEHIIKNKTVIVLDDITTSGVSMKAAINILEDAGAKKVYGFAIAKTSEY